jgi:hypothetical protein
VPLFVSVTVCAALVVPTVWLPNVNVVGDSVTAGTPTAVPVRATVCVLDVALSVSVSVPVCVPALVGANVTEIVQLPPTATVVPHVLVSA